MRLSNEDYVMITKIMNIEMERFNRKLNKLEKSMRKSFTKRKNEDCWMSYDELAKNIVALSGDEYYRDFNIVRMTE